MDSSNINVLADTMVWSALLFAFAGASVLIFAFYGGPRQYGADPKKRRSLVFGRRWRLIASVCLAVAGFLLGSYVAIQVTAVSDERSLPTTVADHPDGGNPELSEMLDRLAGLERSQRETLLELRALRDRPIVVTAEGSRSVVITPTPSTERILVALAGFLLIGTGFFLWFGGWSRLRASKPTGITRS
jgi:drug/metabolite transporter (DMT)-like permease